MVLPRVGTLHTHRGVVHRVALIAATVIGAFLIIFPLVIGLPGKSAASRDLLNAMRPQMSDVAVAQGVADQQTMRTMVSDMNGTMLPALATQMHMTPQQLQAYLGANFPALATGLGQIDTILPYFSNLQSTMAAQQSNFRQADQIPTGFLPPTSMTWLFVIPGVALLLIGGVGLARPARARRLLAVGGAVGVLVAVGLLTTTLYGKAAAADDMNGVFTPVFATANVQQMRSYTDTVSAMSTELSQKALPAIATALHTDPAQFAQSLGRSFPTVAVGISQMPQIVQRMQTATGLIEANVDNFNSMASIPWAPGSMLTVYWFMMVPALLLVALSGGALLLTREGGSVAAVRPAARTGALHT